MQPPSISNFLIAMFACCFLLIAFFGEILVQIGISFTYVSLLFFAFVFASYIFAGMLGGTMQISRFDRGSPVHEPAHLGQAIASAVVSSCIFILMAGKFYSTGTDTLSMFAGFTIGLAIMPVLFSSHIARTRERSLVSAVSKPTHSRLLHGTVLVASLISSSLLLLASVELVESVVSRLLGLPGSVIVLLSVFCVLFCILAGGTYSLTIVRILAFPVIALTFLVPLIWISIKATGNPFPQFSYGSGALVPIGEVDKDMLEVGFANPADLISIAQHGTSMGAFNFLAILVTFAAGTAVTPHILQHFRSAGSGVIARRAGIWSFGLVLLILTAVPAVAVFAKLGIYSSVLGISVSDLSEEAPWIFELSGAGNIPLVLFCGELVRTTAEAIAACGNDPSHLVAPKDILLNGAYITIGSTVLNDLPIIVTAVLVGGSLLAVLTAVDGLLVFIARTIGHDLFGLLGARIATSGKELFVTRLAMLLTASTAALITIRYEMDVTATLYSAFAVAAGSLFPVLLARFWFQGLLGFQIAFSGILGLLTTLLMMYGAGLGSDFSYLTGDEPVSQIPLVTDKFHPAASGLVGLVFALFVLIIFMLRQVYKTKIQSASAANEVDAS